MDYNFLKHHLIIKMTAGKALHTLLLSLELLSHRFPCSQGLPTNHLFFFNLKTSQLSYDFIPLLQNIVPFYSSFINLNTGGCLHFLFSQTLPVIFKPDY